MKNKQKKICNIILGVVVAISIFFIIIFLMADIRVQTSSSGLFTSNYKGYRYNSFFKLRIPCFWSEKVIEEHSDKSLYRDAREYVLNHDYDFFDCNICSEDDFDCIVFQIDNYIYYYHNEDYDNIYRINTDTGRIESRPFSAFALQSNGMHNLSVTNNIIAEGLIDYYDMTSAINSVNGMFYECQMFYCDGRIFFEKSSHLFEYCHESKRVRLIGPVGDSENIVTIWVENGDTGTGTVSP